MLGGRTKTWLQITIVRQKRCKTAFLQDLRQQLNVGFIQNFVRQDEKLKNPP